MAPSTQDDALFIVPNPGRNTGRIGRRRTGRHERHLDRSIKAEGLDKSSLAALVSLARAMARALDVSEQKNDAYQVAQSSRPYLDVLIRLGLAPDRDGIGGEDDPFADVGAPTLGDAAN